MKNLSSLLFATLIISSMFVFDSCKKGEEDPFISIFSRKARITGDWVIQNNDRSTSTLKNEGDTEIIDFIINGQSINITTETKNSSHDTIITIGTSEDGGTVKTASVKFEKDGTYSFLLSYQIIEVDVFEFTDTYTSTVTTTTDTDIEIKGTWNFLGNVEKNYKNKERIALNYERYKWTENVTTRTVNEISGVEQPATSTNSKVDILNEYANGESSVVWEIVMLKNKEVKFFRDIDNYDKFDNSSSGYSEKTVGTETLVLKQ
ncbi:MAG: hypothetical protein JXR58_00035 [Bacteroidales bacterium]|nr:hypothetical protein [Bacteroidales bacterium]